MDNKIIPLLCNESDEEALRILSSASVDSGVGMTFARLIEMFGGDVAKALHAFKEENRFVHEHPTYPTGREYGAFTRMWLVAHGLPWNQENLELSARAYIETHGR